MGRARLDRRERHSRSLSSRRPSGSSFFRFFVSRALRAGACRILAGALFGIVAAALLPAAPAHAQTAQTVQSDWSLIPTGVTAGQSFRLLFVTSTRTAATSTSISTYNTFVQGRADTIAALKPFKAEFRALVSTSATDARTNTLTRSTDTDAPIYWVNGAKVADDYADFYDGTWASYVYRKEDGTQNYFSGFWTGSNNDGTKHASSSRGGPLGDQWATRGSMASGKMLDDSGAAFQTISLVLYALSPVITVQSAPVSKPAKPTGLSATAGDQQVALSWSNPNDASITKYQYIKKAGSAAWETSWTNIPSSAAGETNATSYTVTSLTNGTAYRFRIRAVNTGGNSPQSDEAGPVTPQAPDTTRPTVTASATGYYSDAALSTALAGPLKAGASIYTKVTFSEDMKHVKSNGASARPELFHRIGSSDTRYDILDNGDTLASGDCKPNHATDTDVYVCLYTVGASVNGAFAVKVGTNSVDKADNALASTYTHADTLTLDTTRPTVTAASTGYYSDAELTNALTGPQKAGASIYTKVTFSEDMKHVKSDTLTALPLLVHLFDAIGRYYEIVNHADTLASGECKPNHATDTDVYVCLYTVGTSVNAPFTAQVHTNSVDKAGNAIASHYIHATQVTLDTTDPGIEFPASPAVPRLSTASTIMLTDASAKIKKYGAIVVDGTTGAATDCDTAAEIGTTDLTTETTPKASVNFPYTPPSGSLGKKICVYAEDAAGNSKSGLWDSAIQQAPANVAPTVSSIAITSSPPVGQGGYHKWGDIIDITVTFSEAITFDGDDTSKALTLRVTIGSQTRGFSAYAGVSNSTTITIPVGIGAGFLDTDGISIPANPLSLEGGATIKDADNNNAVLAYAGLGTQSAHKVEAVRPSITFPSSPTVPQVGAQSTITLADANAKVAKYAVLEVAGTATDATDCDDPSTSGDNFTTTPVSPVASSKTVLYTPLAAGKKVCVYAEDAVGNWRAALWDSAIQEAPAKPKVTLVLGSSTIDESGSGNATTIKATLPSAPSAAVTVTLTLNPATGVAALDGTTLTIPTSGTDSNTVTVTAVNNDVDADDATVTISGATTSTLVEAPDAVTLTVSDDDTKGVTLSSTGVSVNEGATATYTVKLDTKPTANVVVTPASGDTGAVTVSTAATNNTLTFTPANWSTAQTVTVTGVQDADSTNESVTVTHTATGGGYAGVSVGSVTVTVDDDEGNVGPAVTSIAITSSPPAGQNGHYKIGDSFTFTVTFSEAVTFDGSDPADRELRLKYNLGGVTKTTFTDIAVSSSTTITVPGVVNEGELDADGISIPANPLSFSGGATIKNASNVNATLTYAGLANQSAHKVDGVRPTVTSVTMNTVSRVYYYTESGTDSTISVDVNFSEAVDVTGAPTLAIKVGDNTRTATFNAGGSGASSKAFPYDVVSGDNDADGISAEAGSITLPSGATIKDYAGNAATNLTHPEMSAQSNHRVDTGDPGIAFPASPAVPRLNTASTITLTDANAKVAKYAVLEVAGTATDATGCDDPSTSGDNFATTAVSPAASPKKVRHTPSSDSLGKKLCVYAEDAAGNGHAAMWNTPIEAASATPAIAGLTAEPSEGSVWLRWTNPPTCTAAAPACRYQYRYRKAGGTWSAWAETLSLVAQQISHLPGGTAHEFEVRRRQGGTTLAKGSVGATTTGARVPARPMGLTATAGDRQVTIAWDDLNDATITKYQVKYRPSSQLTGGSWRDIPNSAPGEANATSWTVTGLRNGIEYEIWVRAVNGNGAGLPFLAIDKPIPSSVTALPGKPRIDKVTAGIRRITVFLLPPNDPTILKYQIALHPPGTNNFRDIPGSNADSSILVVPVPENRAYAFRVRAVNMLGAGTATDVRSVTPSASALPDRPEGLAAVAGSTRVTLRWTDPGDPAITTYQYRQKAAGGSYGGWTDFTATATDTGTRLAYVVTGLQNGTAYTFQIRAVNVNGNGAASAEAGATPSLATVPTVTGVKILSRPEGRDRMQIELADGSMGYSGGETYMKGEKIWIEVTFSSARIAVAGRPVLTLEVGGTSANPVVRTAHFLCLSADNRAVFEYRVVYADKDEDGISVPRNALIPSVHLDRDAIYDPRTDEKVNPNHAGLADDAGHKVNGLFDLPRNLKPPPMPTLKNIVLRSRPADPDRGYVTGEEIRLDAIFTKATPVVDGTPLLQLIVGTETRRAEFEKVWFRSSDGKRWMSFRYTVQAGDSDADGFLIPADPILTNIADRIYRGWDREPAVLTFAGRGTGAGHKVNASGGMGQRGPDGEAVAPPLTATFENAPSEHRGKGKFTVQVAFSEAVAGRAEDAAIQVTGGTLTRARRVDRRKDLWALSIEPSSHAAVTLTLPATSDCASAGAVCTADGRKLETAFTHTVPGPATLSVADARATEGEDATIDFAVTLSRAAAAEVSVRYRTRSGTAKAGRDFEAAKGTLVFAAGETAKTVAVEIIDDAHNEDVESFKLVLSRPKGAHIADGEATGQLVNSDPLQQAWLARFGRTAASDAVAAVTARLETPRDAGSHVTLGGHRLSLGGAGDTGSVLPPPPATGPDRLAWSDDQPDAGASRTMSARELLMGTSFRAVLGQGAGSQFTSWGQGAAVSRFSGSVPGLSLSGETATGSFGMDYERGRLLAGFAMTHSFGDGTAHGADRRYLMGSSVTTALPFARLAISDRVSAWGLAGSGSGRLTLALDGGPAERYRTDLAMTLAAVGVRGDLVTPATAGGFALAFKADAFWVRTESDSVSAPGVGNLAAGQAEASRLRAVLDGSRTFLLAGGGTLTPSVALGLRQDGGDAETGSGMELGAGVGYADPSRGLDMTLRVHGLAGHSQAGYGEWGVSGSVRLAPGDAGRGLSLSLVPSYGAAPVGSERLWALPDAHALATHDGADPSSRLDAEVGYGLAVFGGFTGTPNVGLGLSDTARNVRIGWRLSPVTGGGFELNLDTIRQEVVDDAEPDHGVMLRSVARW